MKKLNNLLILLMILSLGGMTSCVKEDYDNPGTANVDPAGITATHTIAQLQAMAVSANPVEITTDIIVAGIIIADDESGSFYKEIIIQDSTGGLGIQVDVSNFHTNYPIGRRIFVKCKGLYVANDAGNYTLGVQNANEIGRIPQSLLTQYIIKGKWGLSVAPTEYTIAGLATAPGNILIKLNNVEFKRSDAGVTYADAVNLIFKNRTIQDCSATPKTVILYTSGYAKFASQLTPYGNGSIIAVNKRYNNAPELILRNTSEVNMEDSLCNGSAGTLTLMPIDSVRMLHTGTTTSVPFGKKIKGVVTSDYVNANTDPRNLTLQDGTAGICVRFSANHNFPVGAEIEINCSGQELSVYNGWLQLNNVSVTNVIQTGTGTVVPRVVTISQLLANFQTWESTLVTVQNATISGSGTTYSGSRTLTDATGSLTLFTRSQALFSGQNYPTTPVSVTGYTSEFTTSTFNPQLSIRTTADVQ